MSARRLLLVLIALGLSLALVGSAFGVPSAVPSASASAPRATVSAGPSAVAPPAASASAPVAASASAAPAESARALPPGHPPHGARRPPRGEEFEAPEDTTEDDPSLPVGTIVARIEDGSSKPVPGVEITLHTLESSVTKGDTTSRLTSVTDRSGEARFPALRVASAISYKISVERDGARFESDARPLGREAGQRVLLHVYPATRNLEGVKVVMFTGVSLMLREDALQVEQVFQILNASATAWIPTGVEFPLPEGVKAFVPQETGSLVTARERDGRVRFEGTVGPGRSVVLFRYQVPLDGNVKQTLELKLPPRVGSARIIGDMGRKITFEAPTFEPPHHEQTRDGKKVLYTERQILPAEIKQGGIPALTLVVDGLPKKPYGPWVAVVFAVCLAGGGLGFALSRRARAAASSRAESFADLQEARDALYRELDALDAARAAEEIGPKTYERVRAAILDALARVLERLDLVTPVKKKKRKKALA